MDEWTRWNVPPDWEDLALTTAADGRFTFRFWPPPPLSFSLRLQGEGLASLSGWWPEIAPGAVEDLGDVVVPAGVGVRGMVLDAEGAAAAGARLDFTHRGSDATIRPAWGFSARAGGDGRFETLPTLAAGMEYVVTVGEYGGWRLEPPQLVTLPGGQRWKDLVLRVERVEPPDEALAGVVVDEAGRPVARATVSASEGLGREGRGSRMSDEVGRFRIPRHQLSRGPVRLAVIARGHDPLRPEEEFAWGREDLRFVLRRSLSLEVQVLTTDGRVPVEEFQVRVLPRVRAFAVEGAVRAHGRHEGGRVLLSGIPRGSHYVFVEPRDATLDASGLEPVEVADPGPAAVTVLLPRRLERLLRVQRSGGEPVAGTRVVLADPLGRPPSLAMQPVPVGAVEWHEGRYALQLQDATTSSTGETVLRGPDRPGLAIFLLGPGHRAMVVPGVALAEEAPLVVTVEAGARLVGRVRPAQVVADLRLQAGLPPTGPVETGPNLLPSVALVRDTPTRRIWFPSLGEPQVFLEEDGTFTVEDVPPGTWDVGIRWNVHQTVNGQVRLSPFEVVAPVDFQEGTTTEVDLDLSTLLHGEVEGAALHNGEPVAKAVLRLYELPGLLPRSAAFRTDAQGRFRVRARQGTYRLVLPWPPGRHDNLGFLARWRFMEEIRVLPGQTTTGTFQLQTGTLRLRLLDPAGRPLPGRQVRLRDAAGRLLPAAALPATGEDGGTEGEVEAGTFQVEVRGKEEAGPLVLGEVTPRMGETVEAVLRLPPGGSR